MVYKVVVTTRGEDFWDDLKRLSVADPDLYDDFDKEGMEELTVRMLDRLGSRTTRREFDLLDASVLTMLYSYWKGLTYRDSWRKHGETISIFANVSRKYDRAEYLLTGSEDATPCDEPVEETVVDLLVYVTKWVTWISRQGGRPTEFAEYLVKTRQEFGCEIKESDPGS